MKRLVSHFWIVTDPYETTPYQEPNNGKRRGDKHVEREVTQVHTDQGQYEDQLSLLQVASLVVRRRRLIFVLTLVGTLLGVGFAFLSPPEYTTTASFLANEGDQGALSGAAGLAQQFGFALPSSNGAARSPEFYRDLLQSREILSGVILPAPPTEDLVV